MLCRENDEARIPWLRAFSILASLLVVSVLSLSCSRERPRPNVIIVIWDTVRADHMSVYGYGEPTTPFLETWGRHARVFENCVSTANSTVPSHGSLFTGLYPIEHGANNDHHRLLDPKHVTLAERFGEAGYDTYLFAANPHVAGANSFAQGFDVEEHPWDDSRRAEALAIVRKKIDPRDRSQGLRGQLAVADPRRWAIKACGSLAGKSLLEWLGGRDEERPFFAVLNYMEAHGPYIPELRFRERLMTPEQIQASFSVDGSWNHIWGYTFGLREYTAEELDVMGLTYDACIAELDALFGDLIGKLEQEGYMDNTVVVLTADHGEHLGDHHRIDHQYSVYDGLLRVPLLLRLPGNKQAGRDAAPVMNFDLFPTLLDLAGIDHDAREPVRAVSLLHPDPDRERMGEYLNDFGKPIRILSEAFPDWDPAPFRQRLTALYRGGWKLIRSSGGAVELYDLRGDPGELANLAPSKSSIVTSMIRTLDSLNARLTPWEEGEEDPPLSEEEKARLEALGYSGD